MQTGTNDNRDCDSEREFPYLAGLGLTKDELSALRTQGFVSEELRGRNCVCYRLRFRLNRQRVVYLGTDDKLANHIREELLVLQRDHRILRQANALVREARKTIRKSKKELEPLLMKVGYHFHGNGIRKSRSN
jgi:hypothetical protein